MGYTVTKPVLDISYPHQKVHQGQFFLLERIVSSLADNVSIDVVLSTGNQSLHASFGSIVRGDSEIFIYESPTVSNGSVIDIINQNRNSTRQSTATAVHTPTVTSVGTLLTHNLIVGGAVGHAVGGAMSGALREGSEWVLKPNTKYLIRLTNKSGQARDLQLQCAFYEQV